MLLKRYIFAALLPHFLSFLPHFLAKLLVRYRTFLHKKPHQNLVPDLVSKTKSSGSVDR